MKHPIIKLAILSALMINFENAFARNDAQSIIKNIIYKSISNSGISGQIHIELAPIQDLYNCRVNVFLPDSVSLTDTHTTDPAVLRKDSVLQFDKYIHISRYSNFKIKVVVSGQTENGVKVGENGYLYFYWNNNDYVVRISRNANCNSALMPNLIAETEGLNVFNLLESMTTINRDLNTYSSLIDSLKVRGSVYYADRNLQQIPFKYSEIRLVCKQSNGAMVVAKTITNSDGNFSLSIPHDENLYDKEMSILSYTRSYISLPEKSIGIAEVLDEISRKPYYCSSATFAVSSANWGNIQINIQIKETVDQGACSVFQSFVHGWLLAKENLGIEMQKVVVCWPSYYSTYGDTIRVLQGDRWDRDVLLHEYGHFVDDQYNITKTPGGDHFFDQNLSTRYDQETAKKLAWGEGWADFFAIAIQYEETKDSYYDDTEDINMHVNLDGPVKHPGVDCEAAVAAILWDIFDEAKEPYDNLFLGIHPIFKLASTSGPIPDVDHFITLWAQHDLGHLAEINSIYSEYTHSYLSSVYKCEKMLPGEFAVKNYPNPFNSETTIYYTLSKPGWLNLTIFNVLGKKVTILINEESEELLDYIKWDGRDDNFIQVASGVYYAVIQSNEEKRWCKLLLMK